MTDLYATGAAEAWRELMRSRPKRLEVTCGCGAHWIQGAEHPVKACVICKTAPWELEVRAADGTDGRLVIDRGVAWWRPWETA